MKDHPRETREVILEAAIALFNSKGFKGATIRDIAARANVNIANISYYFRGKQGLLEECLVRFFEPYLKCLDEEIVKLDKERADICLTRAIKKILQYQSENRLLARFVWREVTIDSQISREIISSYLMKERFYLKTMIQSALKEHKTALPISMIVIQLKGMLMMPYVNSLYVAEVWGMNLNESYFIEKYHSTIHQWLESLFGGKEIQKSVIAL
ncbi:forespore capture DNA-binding protein RefZ [Bacillus niameyensis]|uniref:forespore capture DNA-binding protein RefZ n=1 Tax=Bacillus niameyensis TaxID=1522308 RepID=UPI0007806EC1|nr:forespore capture DNA-binding protein RefZ [Bacillus niameyensis]